MHCNIVQITLDFAQISNICEAWQLSDARQMADACEPRLGGQVLFLVIVLAAIIGGLLTIALAYPMGLAVAVMAAPMGASVAAVLVVGYLALRRSNVRARQARAQAPLADPYKPHDASANFDPLSPA